MRTAQLGDIVEIKGGGTPDKSVDAYWGGDIPWASVKDFKSWEISKTTDSITTLGVKNSATNVIPEGMILVPTRMAVGKAAVNLIPMAINQDLKALFPKSVVDTRYLLHALLSKARILERQATGATVKGITLDVLRTLEIPLPALPEQKRIAAILDQADELRRKRQRSIERLGQLGQAIFYEMFGEIRTASKRFVTKKFGEIADVRLGKMLDKGKQKGGKMLPYLRNANIRWFNFDLTDLFDMEFAESELERFSVRPGDLLICEGGEPGRCAIWNEGERTVYYQKALHRARLNMQIAHPQFVAHWFYIASKTGLLEDSVTSATIAHLTGEKIKLLEVFLPPIELQNRFACAVSSVNESLKLLSSGKDATAKMFASLQHRAFTGTS